MIPCKENKCLLLPICKGKISIECVELTSYYGTLTDGTYDSGADIWIVIEETLPKLKEIVGPMKRAFHFKYRSYKIVKYPNQPDRSEKI